MDTKSKILDIAMNLTRIGNWAADDFYGKQKRIELFLKQTEDYIGSIDKSTLSDRFQKTYTHFLKEFEKLDKTTLTSPDHQLLWAEKLMTWGNILTHRASLV